MGKLEIAQGTSGFEDEGIALEAGGMSGDAPGGAVDDGPSVGEVR